MENLLLLLAPGNEDPLMRARAAAFLLLVSALVGLLLLLLLFWRLTRDLERETFAASLGLILLLLALAGLARAGRPEWASGILAALFLAFCVRDVWAYGPSSAGGGAMTVPVLLASFGIGPGWGSLAAGFGIAAVWTAALRRAAPSFAPPADPSRNRWAFHAPALTLVLLLTAALSEFWSGWILLH